MLIKYAFSKVIDKYGNKSFEILFVVTIIIILAIAIYNFFSKDGSNGTWTSEKYYNLLPISEKKSNDKTESKKGDSKGETECRRVLRKIFNRPFEKARPDFLNNPVTGGNYNLELDCFESDLKIACEYNGRQHYDYIPFFHKNKEAFLNQKYRDDMKRRICKENNITLIEVNYQTPIVNIEHYIISELTGAGIL